MQCNWLLDHFVFKQPVLSLHRELLGCLLLKFRQTGRSVVSTLQLCALAEWYSLTVGDKIFFAGNVVDKKNNGLKKE